MLLLLAAACSFQYSDKHDGLGPTQNDTGDPCPDDLDKDGDGWLSNEHATYLAVCSGYAGAGDCNDEDASVNPGVEESVDADNVSDEVDNDCDGEIDEQESYIMYEDVDGDGYGDVSTAVSVLESDIAEYEDAGYVYESGDCNDEDASIYPDADELCNGVDDDCDSLIDDADDDVVDATTWYADNDGDEYGDEATSQVACEQPRNYVEESGDCKDDDSAYHPGAPEIDCTDPNDYNCDGSVGYEDVDGDGYPACEECDDSDASVTTLTWYRDVDGDGYGDASSSTTSTDEGSCTMPSGYADNPDDMDDTDDTLNPETIFYYDADGDGYGDDSTTLTGQTTNPGSDWVTDPGDWDDSDPDIYPGVTLYQDDDGDGYGDPTTGTATYSDPGEGWVTNDDDMDDTDATLNPDTVFYYDADGDGYGDDSITQTGLDTNPGSDWVTASGDWDDTDSAIYPGVTLYEDNDGDGYGDPSTGTATYSDPGTGWVTNSDDMDDTDSSLNPTTTFYLDADGDGYGNTSATGFTTDPRPAYSLVGGDCDDGDATINPDATEVNGNGFDDDCDPSTSYYLSGSGSITDGVMFRGISGNDYAGLEGVITSDMDGDGHDDVVISAIGFDSTNGTNSGVVYVVPESVSSSSTDLDTAGVIPIIGAGTNHWIGRAVSGNGDITGDGIPDLVISSYNPDLAGTYAGVTYVVEGPLSGSVDLTSDFYARLIGEGASDYSGDGALAVVGDTNGDGEQDVVVGAYGAQTNYGGAYLLLGPLSAGDTSLADANGIWTGEEENSLAGFPVAGPGDIDGDGKDELLVGSPGYDSHRGVAYLLFCDCDGDGDLADADSRLLGENTGDTAGRALSGAGDVDGDGYRDLVVGAYGVNGYTGRVYVVGGSSVSGGGDISLASSMASFDGENTADFLGLTVSGGGDVDGDGFDDILLGAEGHDSPSTESGASYLVYGFTSFAGSMALPPSSGAKWTGTAAGDTSGHRVWLGGDVNADGFQDLLIGTYLYDNGPQTDAGASVLFTGGNL